MESSTANQITTPGNQNFFLSPSFPCSASTKPSVLTSPKRNLQPTSPAASVIPQARSASCVISSATILKNALLSSVCPQRGPQSSPARDRVRDLAVAMRKRNLSVYDMQRELAAAGHTISINSLTVLLREEGV